MPKAKKSRNFKAFSEKFELPALEEEVLAFWRASDIFNKSVMARKGKKPFVFYEGPPTANGRPGVHHILSRAFKDIIPRFKAMQGYYVPRKAGWDTHGLPVELEVEKQLSLKSKKDIEAYGIAAFNEKCRESVWTYKDEWERLTERMGFWLDMQHPYITYENSYIDTLWWIIKEIYKKKLLEKDYKIVPWCPRCGTSLSSHELAQGYKEVVDQSVYVKFHLLPNQKFGAYTTKDRAYILSWTTTPWTLPGNVALAVGKNISYSAVRIDAAPELLILATDLVDTVLKGHVIERVHTVKGSDLIGLKYEPLFNVPSLATVASHRVYDAGFVTTTDGTGVVHTAVMYGEDDYALGKRVGLPQYHTVDEGGRFVQSVPGLAGLFVKDKETEKNIFSLLESRNALLRTQEYAHEYPHCWRCGTPLLYYARSAWFVRMRQLKKQLLANNKKINWMPAHIKNGRFGEWLADIKDWNFSRERYWGTPLPIWECAEGHREVISGGNDLAKKMGGAKNKYWTLRHGEAETLLLGIIDHGNGKYHLTPRGQAQERVAARKLKKIGIDVIVYSDILRTKESEAIVNGILKVKEVIRDPRAREINTGEFDGRPEEDYYKFAPRTEERFVKRPEGGETLRDVRARAASLLAHLEQHYNGKKILIISHDYPIWMLFHTAQGWSEAQAIAEKEARGRDGFIKPGQLLQLDYIPGPRSDTGLMDFHRPYIDAVQFPCPRCGKEMRRVKELADVWFDSGAMPFAQVHYPFEGKALVDGKKVFPADYICEAMDQTRGWFYTLLAESTLLGKGIAYKNVIALGLIHDKFGQKMSKSKGNVVNPWDMIGKHGVDAVRWYFYTVSPEGEAKNFDEQEVVKTFRRFHSMLYNSFVFWKTYAKPGRASVPSVRHVLDKWILARLTETERKVTKELSAYHVRDAALALESFADDLSRWYIRRSRRRLQKPVSAADFTAASGTLGFVLLETAKLIAPFTPFFAEALYAAAGGTKESVHLDAWPKAKTVWMKKDVLKAMAEARSISSAGLAKRAEAGIKVRQPLASISAKSKNSPIKGKKEYLEVVQDEVNVKKVLFNPKLKTDIELDTAITPALKEEGIIRELARAIQDLRQKAGLRPQDTIAVMAHVHGALLDVLKRHEALLKNEVRAKSVSFGQSEKFSAEAEADVDGEKVWLAIRKL